MFKVAPRLIARPTAFRAIPRTFAIPQRRLLSTAPPSQKSRSWKSLGARLGAAGGLIYFYNTTDVFAEEPQHTLHTLPETDTESELLPTIESLSSERQKRKAVQAQLDAQRQKQEEEAAKGAPVTQVRGGMEELEEEADQQSAFNPVTGEINWDCPCLGGMADGPCGEEFKAAFSCFVFSKEEPKGMDCIDNFKNMQTCFRKYPEVYGSEMDSDADDDDEAPAEAAAPAQLESSSTKSDAPSIQPSTSSPKTDSSPPPPPGAEKNVEKTATESSSKPQPGKESPSSLVPDNYKPGHKASEAEKAEENTVAESSSRPQPGKENSSPLVPDNYKPGNKH